jgi:hypothetical protein
MSSKKLTLEMIEEFAILCAKNSKNTKRLTISRDDKYVFIYYNRPEDAEPEYTDLINVEELTMTIRQFASMKDENSLLTVTVDREITSCEIGIIHIPRPVMKQAMR